MNLSPRMTNSMRGKKRFNYKALTVQIKRQFPDAYKVHEIVSQPTETLPPQMNGIVHQPHHIYVFGYSLMCG